MAAPVTNDAFLKEKMLKFVDFLKSTLKSRMNNSRYAEFSNKIEELRTLDTAKFIMHITTEMSPWKSNIQGCVEKMLKEQDVASDALTPEEKNKLGRFINCFIDIVSQ